MVRFYRPALVATVAALAALSNTAADAAPPPLTYQQIARMTADDQGKILDPLRTVARATDSVGQAAFSDVYSGVRIDAPAGTVIVYLTNLSRAAAYRTATARTDSHADLSRIRFTQGTRTRVELTSASDAVVQRRDLTVESVVVPPDGSGLVVRAVDPLKARDGLTAAAATRSLAAVPVTVEAAQPGGDLTRLRDTPQWISGEALTEGSDIPFQVWTCTSGLPARRNSDGRSFLITAAHCYGDGATVYTGFENSARNKIGVVTMRDNLDDAIAIDTSSTGTTASREWDGPAGGPYQVLDVTGSAFSYSGDMTCQDGFTSGIVCGLLVNNGSVTWTGQNGVAHRGVEAHQVNGTTAALAADSGGLVFILKGGNIREARGIVSYGGGTLIRWTEAPYIFTAFGMTLAP